MVSRLFSSIGDVLAPPPVHSELDDLKAHWRAIRSFYIDKRDDIESFHEYQLPGHLISMGFILAGENKQNGDAGPCLEFFLKNRILETLCLLGEHDKPQGVRKLILQTITMLLSDLSLPLLPHMSVHKPICSLIKTMINKQQILQQQLFQNQQQQQQILQQQQVNKNSNGLDSLSLSSSSSSSSVTPQQIEDDRSKLLPIGRVPLQSNDDSEFVNLLETLTMILIKYPNLIGFFQENSFKQGENFIVFQGLLGHLWTHGSIGERARKAMIQCLELISEVSIDSPENLLTAPTTTSATSPPPQSTSTSSQPSPLSSTISSGADTIIPLSPLKKSLPISPPLSTIQQQSIQDEKIECIHPDPLSLLNHLKFMNTMISELVKTFNLLPKKIQSSHYFISGPPISTENLNILEYFKSRVSFCCSLSYIKQNNIGEYVLKLWEESFLADTLGPYLLDTDEGNSSTAMLYLKEILPLLEGPILETTISFLLGGTNPTHLFTNNSSSSNGINRSGSNVVSPLNKSGIQFINCKEDDDYFMKKTLINRISSKNFIVSISSLRLFSALVGLRDFNTLYHLILVHLLSNIERGNGNSVNASTTGGSSASSTFSYHGLKNLQLAQRSITSYLNLFGNKYSNLSQLSNESNGSISNIFQNKINSQTNGYSAYLVDARYQISLYSFACSNWPSQFLFQSKESFYKNNNNNIQQPSPSSSSSSLSNNNNNNTTTSNINNIESTSLDSNSQYHGLFLEQLFNLFKNCLSLPIEINFVITGIFSKLCYYPCPLLFPYLIHCDNQNYQNNDNNNNNNNNNIPTTTKTTTTTTTTNNNNEYDDEFNSDDDSFDELEDDEALRIEKIKEKQDKQQQKSPQQNNNNETTNNNNNNPLSIYNVLYNLSIEIEERSKSYQFFNEILDKLRIYMTDSNRITMNEENHFPDDPVLCSLKSSELNFFNAVIILEEFCKELASILQARVVWSSSSSSTPSSQSN